MTTTGMGRSSDPLWRKLYEPAILELDLAKLPDRIEQAKPLRQASRRGRSNRRKRPYNLHADLSAWGHHFGRVADLGGEEPTARGLQPSTQEMKLIRTADSYPRNQNTESDKEGRGRTHESPPLLGRLIVVIQRGGQLKPVLDFFVPFLRDCLGRFRFRERGLHPVPWEEG